MVKKKKLFGLPKFGSLRGSTSASLKLGEILAMLKFWQVFETGARTYFAPLINIFITYSNKIGSTVTFSLKFRDSTLIELRGVAIIL